MALRALLFLIANVALSSVIYSTLQAILGAWSGMQIEEISFFYGRKLYQRSIRGVALSMGWIPIGASVKFFYPIQVNEEENASTPQAGSFASAHPLNRAAVILCGPLSLMLIGVIVLPSQEALRQFAETYGQVWHGARHPLSMGVDLIERAIPFLASARAADGFASVCIKVAALNLIPLPSLAGGEALMSIIRWKRPATSKTIRRQVGLSLIGILFLVVALLAWLTALVGYFARTATGPT